MGWGGMRQNRMGGGGGREGKRGRGGGGTARKKKRGKMLRIGTKKNVRESEGGKFMG